MAQVNWAAQQEERDKQRAWIDLTRRAALVKKIPGGLLPIQLECIRLDMQKAYEAQREGWAIIENSVCVIDGRCDHCEHCRGFAYLPSNMPFSEPPAIRRACICETVDGGYVACDTGW